MTYFNKSTSQLLEIYNKLAPKKIRSWKESKKKLIACIEALKVKSPEPEKKVTVKVKKKSKKSEKKKSSTIQAYAEDLILQVAEHKDGQKMGFSYKHILEEILEEFPGAKTSLNCLRWYAAQLNKIPKNVMPIRPRG